MGIKGLTKLISDNAGAAVKENDIKNFFGRKVAIDASMSVYQFLIAVRSEGSNLTNEDGETTSHIMGMFYRTIRMIDNGIKPVYVFDGKPPTMKSGELAKRYERRKEAEAGLAKAQESGDAAEVEKFTRRTVKVTRKHNDDCKALLKLMGVPYIEAPCEAEAQCAELVKSGKVFATATEDMDALTFGTGILLRHMTFSEARKMPIKEIHLSVALRDLGLDMAQFVDLCILLGCDYCDSIRGIGPKKAIALIQKHKTIEEVLTRLDKKKYIVPADWRYKEARELFFKPEVTPGDELDVKWAQPDEEGIVEFMCLKNGFSEDRIRSAVKKLAKARGKSAQDRLTSFFKVLPGQPSKKRKADPKSKKDLKKAKFGKKGGKPRR